MRSHFPLLWTACLLLSIEGVHAQATSHYDLSVTVSGQLEGFETPLPPVTATSSGDIAFNDPTGVNFQVTAKQEIFPGYSDGAVLNVSAYSNNQDLGIKFVLDSNAQDPYGNTDIVFSWTSADPFTLRPRSPDSVAPNMPMNGHGHLEGVLSFSDIVSLEQAAGFTGILDAYIPVPGGFVPFSAYDAWTGSNRGATGPFRTSNSFALAGPGETSGTYTTTISSDWHFKGDLGQVIIDASHTFKLDSITYEDGSMPEDHGFDIVFASGRVSPNISVPELPSALLLAPTMLAFATIHTLRIRRRRLNLAV